MSLPLKTGADFYNNEAARMRLHNLGADPTEYAAGLIYFNSSTNANTSKKIRVCMGSGEPLWKTLAYAEDLDVASNADFQNLKARVDLLSGDVDTDAIINNMKEVSAFLSGFAEDASLMDLLNSKLDKSGGTISQQLIIASEADSKIVLDETGGDYKYQLIEFRDHGVMYGVLGTMGSGDLKWNGDTLIHSGNIGDYNAGSADVLAYSYANQSINFGREGKLRMICNSTDNATSLGYPRAYTSGLSVVTSYTGWQMVTYGGPDLPNPFFRKLVDDGTWSDWKTIAFTDSTVAAANKVVSHNGITVATVDSGIFNINRDVATGAIFKEGTLGIEIECYSKEIAFKGYDSSNKRVCSIILNDSGNVTIGSSDLAGTSAHDKLCIDGCLAMMMWSARRTVLGFSEGDLYLGFDNISTYNTYVAGNNVLLSPVNNVGIGTTAPEYKLDVNGDIAIALKGASLIFKDMAYLKSYGNKRFLIHNENGLFLGLETPAQDTEIYGKAIRLYANTTIKGDLHVEGNIVADGEVSAGGVAAEGGGTSGGGGGSAAWSQTFTPTTTSITFTHTLGTQDVIVQVYEKDSITGYWNMIICDIEVLSNQQVTLHFGQTENIEHKVVIMG